MAVATYYFDGHIGISDPDGVWSSDALAFDGVIDTGSNRAAYSSGVGGSTKTTRYLQGIGTTASATDIGRISQVRLRIAGGQTSQTFGISATVYTGDASEELGTATAVNGVPAVFGSYVVLTPPTGGWSWSVLNGLLVRFYCDNNFMGTYVGNASIAEIEVTYNQETKFPGSGTNDASVGTLPWINPGNITADDGSYASSAGAFEAGTYSYNRVSLVDSSGSVTSANKSSGLAFPTTGFEYQSFGGASDLWSEAITPAYVNSPNFGAVLGALQAGSLTNYLKASDFGFSVPVDATVEGVQVEIETYNFPQDVGNAIYEARVDTIRITVYYTLPQPPRFLKQQNSRLLLQQNGRGILL